MDHLVHLVSVAGLEAPLERPLRVANSEASLVHQLLVSVVDHFRGMHRCLGVLSSKRELEFSVVFDLLRSSSLESTVDRLVVAVHGLLEIASPVRVFVADDSAKHGLLQGLDRPVQRSQCVCVLRIFYNVPDVLLFQELGKGPSKLRSGVRVDPCGSRLVLKYFPESVRDNSWGLGFQSSGPQLLGEDVQDNQDVLIFFARLSRQICEVGHPPVVDVSC